MDDDPNILQFPIAKHHSPTQILSTKHRVVHHNAGLPQDLLQALEQNPEGVFAAGRVLRATSARAVAQLHWNSQCFVMKHYFERSLRSEIEQDIQGQEPEALRTYQLGCVLADAGVRTPRPAACINNYHQEKLRDSYLLYPFVEGRMLRSSINQELLSDLQVNWVRRQLRSMWRQLTQLNVGLHDANAGNFVVTRNCEVWLIDLDGSRIHNSPVTARWHLFLTWLQVNRSMRRAMRKRGRPCAEVRRAAQLVGNAA